MPNLIFSTPPRNSQSHSIKRFSVRAAAIAALFSTNLFAVAPYLKAEKPIIDKEGRTQVIVDFTHDAHLRYSGNLPLLPKEAGRSQEKPGEFFHTEKSLALVVDYENRYGFIRLGMTSWVGNSVTAMVLPETIKRLQNDPLVKQVSDDNFSKFSANPPSTWTNIFGSETTSWGHMAVNGKFATSNTGRKIYIIDSGVAVHDDLPDATQMTRLNVACGASGNCNPIEYPVVGCYAHATHVAGIIGAKADNSKTVKGAYAGSQGYPKLVSLSVLKRTVDVNPDNCADAPFDPPGTQAPTFSAHGYALDYIAWDTTYNYPTQMVHIATMSMNSGGVAYQYGTPEPNWSKLNALVNTIWAYGIPVKPGVFFVQSAGNTNNTSDFDACAVSYRPGQAEPASAYDGVMVVAAAHATGQAVSESLRFSGSWPTNLSGEDASYFSRSGSCVDVWAPGNLIASTWGAHVGHTVLGPTYTGNVLESGTTQGWGFLSRTSMAAPFVAAAAAWLADTYSLTTPAEVEQAVRNNSYQWYGYTDSSGLPVKMVQLP